MPTRQMTANASHLIVEQLDPMGRPLDKIDNLGQDFITMLGSRGTTATPSADR